MTSDEVNRLLDRVAELEAWRAEMTKCIVTRAVEVVADNGEPRVRITGGNDMAAISILADHHSDQAPAIYLEASLEDPLEPFAHLMFRNRDQTVVELGFNSYDDEGNELELAAGVGVEELWAEVRRLRAALVGASGALLSGGAPGLVVKEEGAP